MTNPVDASTAAVDRRRFLALAAAGVTTVAACSDTTTGDSTSAESSARSAPTAIAPARPDDPAVALAEDVFALGVASGDPTDSAVILWTRLAGLDTDDDVEVAFDVAADEGFGTLVASDVTTASAALGHSVHVDVTALRSDTWYYYRFRAGDRTSPVGRTRTFPAADAAVDQLRVVAASCQDFQWGTYVLWRHAAAEEPDAVVFLGDYIYELSFGDLSPEKDGSRVWETGPPTDLAGYRSRYEQTKRDENLQAAHAVAPWIVTWDDHEVSNNYAGDVAQTDVTRPASRARRIAAYQAFYEHQPVRIDPPPTTFESIDLHRSFRFGNLADLVVIETRQHADVPPCRTDGGLGADDGPTCDEREDDTRTNLGDEQERWLHAAIERADATWFILCNPLMLASINSGTEDAPTFTRDTWDGYPGARRRLLDALVDAEVENPVIVTGDWHASFVNDIAATPGGETIATEFVGSSISTVLFPDDYRAANPHIRYFEAAHCYQLITVTPDEFRCDYRYVDDVWDTEAPLARTDSWAVRAGEHEARAL